MHRRALPLVLVFVGILSVPVLVAQTAAPAAPPAASSAAAPPANPPFTYVAGKAYHVLPETHNNESGYSSLCEGAA